MQKFINKGGGNYELKNTDVKNAQFNAFNKAGNAFDTFDTPQG